MKKWLLFALAVMILLPLCAQEQRHEEKTTLIAFFSATGTTKAAARRLAGKHYGSFIWEIQAAEPYTEDDLDWRNANSRSSLEMKDPNARPALKRRTNVQAFDTIYIGFPIWWGICPRIINSWIDNNFPQLEGKTLIPFATSGSSGIEEAVAYLRKTYPTLKWEDGILMNKK